MGRPVQGHPIWFLPSIPCCISTYSRCQVLRSVAMNITWNGTEQSCFLPGCTYIYWKTAILKVSRELLCFALHWAVKLGTGCFRAFLMPCVGAGAAVSGYYWSELTTAPKPGVFLPSDWESLLRSKQAFEENPQGVWGRPSVYSSSTVLSFLVTWLRMLPSLKFHPNQLTPKFNINLATFCFSATMITNPPPNTHHHPCSVFSQRFIFGLSANQRHLILQSSYGKNQPGYYGELSNNCGKFSDHIPSLCNSFIPP